MSNTYKKNQNKIIENFRYIFFLKSNAFSHMKKIRCRYCMLSSTAATGASVQTGRLAAPERALVVARGGVALPRPPRPPRRMRAGGAPAAPRSPAPPLISRESDGATCTVYVPCVPLVGHLSVATNSLKDGDT